MTDYFICDVDESVSVALGAFGPGKALHGGCHQEEPSLGLGCNQGGNDSPGKRQGLWPSFACREGSLAAVSSSYIPVLTSLRVVFSPERLCILARNLSWPVWLEHFSARSHLA